MEAMNKVDIEFLLNKMPVGVLVFDEAMSVAYSNRNAKQFIHRCGIPEELSSVSKRIFEAYRAGRMRELFPGEVCIYKTFDNSPSRWTFTLHLSEGTKPLVNVFVIEDTVSRMLDLNTIRARYRLTRREMDVLRRVLNGRKNTEIAEELQISEQTVKDHLSNIYMKCGVENRFALLSSLMNFSDKGVAPAEFIDDQK
jgi:DNA-binding CsgD family transcriptional regulator